MSLTKAEELKYKAKLWRNNMVKDFLGITPKERPILFSGPMVQAILEGRKTQTRRLVKDPINAFNGAAFGETRCPYGKVGDRIWVKETWRVAYQYNKTKPRDLKPRSMTVFYSAGGGASNDLKGGWKVHNDNIASPPWTGKVRQSIFMPRWASRITLEITAVRVERLNDISRGDCMDEGCPYPNLAGSTDVLDWYQMIWEEMNGLGSWDANPWVWVIEFKRVEA